MPEAKLWALSTTEKVWTFNWVQLPVLSAVRRKEVVTGRDSGEPATANLAHFLAITNGHCSPDPVLTGVMMAETIKGIQSQGVMACAKHYIGNEQEHFRQAPEAGNYGFNITDSLSSNIDDVTMHELYLWYVKRVVSMF